jgi:predicted  nucleic acid-binding Zn-ribbon protein
MKTILFAALGILWTCPLVLGQSATSAASDAKNATTDAKTLQALLDEVHRLRQDLQTTSATVQRAQILLYRLRLQVEAVERASQNLEQAKAAAAQIRSARQYFADRRKQQEQFLEQTSDPETRKPIESQIESMKDQFAQFENQEPEAQAKETECANQLRIEQGQLDQLQEQLDRLDRKLQVAARQPVLAVDANGPH